MAKQLKDDELAVIVERAIAKAEDFSDSRLSNERRRTLGYYRGDLPKPIFKGDSSYVSRDVYDTVDSMRATILETFSAHQRIVYFSPEKGETIDDARQATEYCRHVFYKQNEGEDILWDVLTDGLLNRFSVVKVYYEETPYEVEYDFENLTEDELVQFVADLDEYEFKNADTDAFAMGLYTGTISHLRRKKRIVVEVLEPEDFLIVGYSKDIQSSKAAIHRMQKTKSDLLKSGFDRKLVEALTFETSRPIHHDSERFRRFEPVGSALGSDDVVEEADALMDVYEVYMDVDMEKTGRTSLWKITYAGNVILDKEKVRKKPFAAFVPIPTPHTFFGENFAASVIPIQNARTILQRQIINHAIRTNTTRKFVLNGTLNNPAELLDTRPGGLVNVRRLDGVMPEPQNPLNPYVFNLIQMLDEDKEESTGISKLSQGLNKDAISTQNSQGLVENLINASQQRQKIIARNFGKFVRSVYDLIYHTAIDYIEEDEFVAVTGEYVPVNPTDWHERTAASVELSLGYGEREQEGMKYVQLDQMFMADPMLQVAYTPEKRWEVLRRATERMGIEDLSSLLTPPEELQPPQPSEEETAQLEYLKAQTEHLRAQAQAITMKAQIDQMRAQLEQQKIEGKVVLDAAMRDLNEREFQHEVELDWAELAAAKEAEDKRGILSAG